LVVKKAGNWVVLMVEMLEKNLAAMMDLKLVVHLAASKVDWKEI
jgi:hypothetical protein